jgi:hypothetical protein
MGTDGSIKIRRNYKTWLAARHLHIRQAVLLDSPCMLPYQKKGGKIPKCFRCPSTSKSVPRTDISSTARDAGISERESAHVPKLESAPGVNESELPLPRTTSITAMEEQGHLSSLHSTDAVTSCPSLQEWGCEIQPQLGGSEYIAAQVYPGLRASNSLAKWKSKIASSPFRFSRSRPHVGIPAQ